MIAQLAFKCMQGPSYMEGLKGNCKRTQLSTDTKAHRIADELTTV